ncbi:hypothetical protein ACFT5C_21610 [Streptomyces sp. NPDC057116]|uniref:hypothetical protein n=1 Tax=Streptomyces sp. NPDC057116 TaxID=3346023 RepID=UPI00364036E3
MVTASPALVSAPVDSTGSASAWFALAGALGGVLITSAIALATAILNHKWQTRTAERGVHWEYSRQLRQDRLEIYSKYLSAWNRLTQQLLEVKKAVDALDPAPPDTSEARARIPADIAAEVQAATASWREAFNLVFLIGGQEVVDALNDHRRSTSKRVQESWRGEYATDAATHIALTNAMRRDVAEAPSN